MTIKIENTFSADGSTAASNVETSKTKEYTLIATGTFGSGTLVAQISADGTNYVTAKDEAGNAVSLTAAGCFNFELTSDIDDPVRLRLTLSGSTSPSLTATLYEGA